MEPLPEGTDLSRVLPQQQGTVAVANHLRNGAIGGEVGVRPRVPRANPAFIRADANSGRAPVSDGMAAIGDGVAADGNVEEERLDGDDLHLGTSETQDA